MKWVTLPRVALSVCLVSACSTKSLEPEIGAFGGSVEVALDGAEREFQGMKLDDRLREDKIATMTRANGFYQLGCDGSYVSTLEIDLELPKQVPLSETCPLNSFDGNGEKFEYIPSEDTLSEAVQARRLINPLRSYAMALENLSKSTAPEEVSQKFTAASNALRDLAVNVSEMDGGSGIDPKDQQIIEAGSGLAAILVREGLEAMRYSALSSIVRNGDEAVHGAGLILATWMQRREDDELSNAMQVVRENQQAAIESRFAGDPLNVRRTRNSEVVEAYDAAIEADQDAKWRVFIGMVIAHKALKEAFDRPADFARLQEAQARLDDFVDQALKLKAALDAE